MPKTKEEKKRDKEIKKAERKQKWNATKEIAKETFSKFGKSVKKVFKPKDKSAAQEANAKVFTAAVSALKELRPKLSKVKDLAGDMFIKDGSNAKTSVDPEAFGKYNDQIKALGKGIIEIKNRINAGVGGLQEKESRSESLKTLNTLNTILTRIAEILDRISEVDLPAGENYPEQLINELRQLLSQLNLLLKNIKSISKKHAVFGGPALYQLSDLRAILNLFLSDFTETIVQINNTMDNTSKPESFKYSTRLDDGTKVGVKAISGDVGKVVTNKRELKRDDITRLLNATSQISNGAERASEIQRILRSAGHDLQLMFGAVRSAVSAVRRSGLSTAEKTLNEYLEHLIELLRRLENLYHTNEYPDPKAFADQLAGMIAKAENMKKKVLNLLKKLSSKVQKTSQYSKIIEILNGIDQSVADMVNAEGLVIPEQPVKEQPVDLDKDDANDENNDDDGPDDNDNNGGDIPTNSDDGGDEHQSGTGLRNARRGSESDEDDRADYLFRIATEQDPPPAGTTPLKARSELKDLAKTNQHAYDLWKKCKLTPKTDTSTQTGPRLGFENQTIYEKHPQGLPPTIYRRKKPTRPPTVVALSRQTPRRTRSEDSPEIDYDLASPDIGPDRAASDRGGSSLPDLDELDAVLREHLDEYNEYNLKLALHQLKAKALNKKDPEHTEAKKLLTFHGMGKESNMKAWLAVRRLLANHWANIKHGANSEIPSESEKAQTSFQHLQSLASILGGYAEEICTKAASLFDMKSENSENRSESVIQKTVKEKPTNLDSSQQAEERRAFTKNLDSDNKNESGSEKKNSD